jgi:carboxymethylenebutenolidase
MEVWQSMEITEGMTEFFVDDSPVPCYLARPMAGEVHPGVVLIQEWWGLVPHIKDVAGRFARQGFVALAPDLYHGREASEPDEARKLAMELDRERAVGEIAEAVRYLKQLDTPQPRPVGIVGWCMGGSLAISTAAVCQEVGASVAFYGMPRDLEQLPVIKSPLLGLYAGHDHGITLEAVDELQRRLERDGTPHEIHVYHEAQHAFFNDARPHIYDPQAAQDAWKRTLAWFRQYLR